MKIEDLELMLKLLNINSGTDISEIFIVPEIISVSTKPKSGEFIINL